MKTAAAIAAIALLGGVTLAITQGGEIKGLFETADAEIDTVGGGMGGSYVPPRRSWFASKAPPASPACDLPPATGPYAPPRPSDNAFPAMDAAASAELDTISDLSFISGGSERGPARNGYLSSTYVGGSGALDHMAELIDGGIMLDGESISLGALTASYHQPVAVPPNRALSLFANPEHTRIAASGGTTHIQIGVQAAQRELATRQPIQLLLVLDTSGSMSGEKMAQARAAALGMVGKLAPTDEFGLITYADTATVDRALGPVGDGGESRKAVMAAQSGGGTNISDALELAYNRLGDKRSKDGISRVVLLSDGEPTQGITAPSHLRRLAWIAFQDGMQTTTLGFGTKFNSDLMMGIARDGKGNYHFVRDGEQLTRVLDEELDQLTHVVAQAVRLRIELPDNVGLLRVLGADVLGEQEAAQVRTEEKNLDARVAAELGIAADREDDDDDGLKLVIPALHMGRHHVVMLEVSVPPGADGMDLATVEVKYKDLLGRTNRTETATARIERSASQAAAVSSLDPAVKKNVLGFQTGEAMVRAGALVQARQLSDAVALIDDQMTLLGVAADRWRDADLADDVTLLGRYKTVLTAHGRGTLGREAQGYMAKALAYNGYKLTR